MSHQPVSNPSDSTLDLYSDEYHRRLADPGESFSAHYAAEYTRLVRPVKGESVLEIGCASGRTSELLLERGVDVTGIDFDERACESSRARLERFGERSKVVCASADAITDFSPYDKVLMLDFVEHVDDALLGRILDNMRSKYDGPVFVYTPNLFHPYEWAQRLHLVSGDPTHINVKPWWRWKSFFESLGMRVVRSEPATSHPRWLAAIERPLLRVPLLNRIFIRSIGLELAFR